MLFFDNSIFSLFYIMYVILTAAAPTSDFVVNHNNTSTGIPFQLPSEVKVGCSTADGTLIEPYDSKVDISNTNSTMNKYIIPIPRTDLWLQLSDFSRCMSYANLRGLYLQVMDDLQSKVDSGQAERIPSGFAYEYTDPHRPLYSPATIIWKQGIRRQRGSYRDLVLVVRTLRTATTGSESLPLELLNREFVYTLFWQPSLRGNALEVGTGVVDRNDLAALKGSPAGTGSVSS